MNNPDPIEQLIKTILFEGYWLYPYRRDTVKNQYRWNFGVLFPREYCVEHAEENSGLETECFLAGGPKTEISAEARFLGLTGESAEERILRTGTISLGRLLENEWSLEFACGELRGRFELRARRIEEGVFGCSVRVRNLSAHPGRDRGTALQHSLISALVLLEAKGGRWYSHLDPPDFLPTRKTERRQTVWPVLVGEAAGANRILAAPIILPDYPQIAPESAGDFFDGTEMDDMLALRILTLSEEEKDRMRGGEERVRKLLERAEELLGRLDFQGRLRCLDEIPRLKAGARVRLCPRAGRDIFDLALQGKEAVITSVESDMEGRVFFAVVVEEDPGKDLGIDGRPGHRFYFRLDEVEAL